jgi:hypothetical protein
VKKKISTQLTNTIKISSLKLGDKELILKVRCIDKSNLRQSDKTNGYRFHVDIKDWVSIYAQIISKRDGFN